MTHAPDPPPQVCLTVHHPTDYVRAIRPVAAKSHALTHLAYVRDGSKLARCYVKAYMPSATKGLINEVIGYTIAHHAGLAQPRGGLICIPGSVIAKMFEPFPVPEGPLRCFVSMEVSNGSGSAAGSAKVLFNSNVPNAAASLQKWGACPKLAAVDEWTANIDRNLGNLLMVAAHEYQIIDHGHLLTGPAWTSEDMNPLQWARNKLIDDILPKRLSLPIKSAMLNTAESFQAVLGKASPELTWWLTGDDSSDNDAARGFLRERSKNTLELLRERLGMVT